MATPWRLILTLVLTLFFVIEGVISIMYALGAWMLLSGVVDLVLASIIVLELPGTAVGQSACWWVSTCSSAGLSSSEWPCMLVASICSLARARAEPPPFGIPFRTSIQVGPSEL